MIKFIEDFKTVGVADQYEKIKEEIGEAAAEYVSGNIEAEQQELCDVIQACYSRFSQMGMKKGEIQAAWDKHYEKETLRNRKVVEIEGQGYHESVRSQLLGAITFLEKENTILNRKMDLMDVVIKSN